MNVFEFIKSIDRLKLTKDQLIKLYPDKDLQRFYESVLTITPRSENSIINSGIPDLITHYNVQTFKVFSLSFLNVLDDVGDFILFGENESNSLGINKIDGQVYEILYTDIGDFKSGITDRIVNSQLVSRDQYRYLSSLSKISELCYKVILKEVNYKDKEKKIEYGEIAATESGGDIYKRFWFNLLNIE